VLRAATVLGLAAAVASVAPAQEESAPSKRVRVTLVVILACEKGDMVDPALKCIAAEVRRRDPQLKCFRQDSMRQRSLAVNQLTSFMLPGGKTAQVVVKQAADKNQRVELAITPPCGGEIVYRTVCGKFLPIVTRCQTADKERIILAVRVQPCNGK
jgi:hypothetical protein